jgi:hypothetical protein
VISYADKQLRLNNLLRPVALFFLSYKFHWYMTEAQRMNIKFVSFVRAWKQTFYVIDLQRALLRLTSLALSGQGSGRAALWSGKISSVESWYKTAYALL